MKCKILDNKKKNNPQLTMSTWLLINLSLQMEQVKFQAQLMQNMYLIPQTQVAELRILMVV